MNDAAIRARVLEEARSFIHTPYHHRGMLKGIGVDCLTLLVLVYREIGIVPRDYDPGPYSREWYLHKSEELYLNGVKQFARELTDGMAPLPGDVALYKIGHCVSHGAIIVDDEHVIHADRKNRQVELTLRRTPNLIDHLHSYWTPFP